MKTITVWTSEYAQSVYGQDRYGEKILQTEEFEKEPVKVSFSKDATVSFEKDMLTITFDVERETAFEKEPIKTEFNYE